MTARDGQPYARASAVQDALTLLVFPVSLLAGLVGAFAGGGTRRWFGGRGENQRAEAQAAKDAAAAAFYELDTAQRDLRISIETITAVDGSPAARGPWPISARWGGGSTRSAPAYITAVDAHDLDRDDLEVAEVAHARHAS